MNAACGKQKGSGDNHSYNELQGAKEDLEE
jgi:hypothetical protein